ncbi:response regulator [Gloeomargarita lithophora Alchichica-D10]|uniref:Response regulator n=1 Tax=Gloeomargarita lithophora Alchichica-D10 TaxID=1188229 RepID=A0A1J0AEB5_9CYAN|nr:response regulator [Gloeomargarita lithophora]APB34282.1 response regulator [Gloeomargarita lithophora Alchichica-D10]
MTFAPADPIQILVIDDSMVVRELIAQYLENGGYILETAANGEVAWAAICQSPPDLIISDWSMPGISGIELCRRVKSDPGLQHIYFLMLTAREDASDRVLGLDTGADEFISKPINAEELRARIRAALRVRQLTRSLMTANQRLQDQNNLLASMSLLDGETGVLNQRALTSALPGLLQQVGERPPDHIPVDENYILYYRYLNFWLLAVDHWSELESKYGSEVLRQVVTVVARRLQSRGLPGSLVYRSEPNQFACLTLGLSPQRAYEFGQTLRQGISDHPVSLSSELSVAVTVTLGGVVVTKEPPLEGEQVLQQVQDVLAKAQSLGANQLVLLGYEPDLDTKAREGWG